MNIGNQRDIHSLNYLCKSSGIGSGGDSDSYKFAAGHDKLIYLLNAAVDINRRHLCHRLDDKGSAGTDFN